MTVVKNVGFPCCCLTYEDPSEASKDIFEEAEGLVEVCRIRFASTPPRSDASIAFEGFKQQLERCATAIEAAQDTGERLRLKGRYDVWRAQYIVFARKLGYKDQPRRLSMVMQVKVKSRKS